MATESYHFYTIETPSEGLYVSKGSKFISYAIPITSSDDIKQHFNHIKTLHPKARHHCYAYRIGIHGNNFRVNDDGEPSGTAGKPILGQIDHFKLCNVIIFVVRYFGGVLLGTSGLITAYKMSAKNAIELATIIEKPIGCVYHLASDVVSIQIIMGTLRKLQIAIDKMELTFDPHIEFFVPNKDKITIFTKLKSQYEKISMSDIGDPLDIRNCEITIINK